MLIINVVLTKPEKTVARYRSGLNLDLVVRSRVGEGTSVSPPFVTLNLKLYLYDDAEFSKLNPKHIYGIVIP